MRKVLIGLSSFIFLLTIFIAWVMLDGYRVYRFRTSLDEIPIDRNVNSEGLRELNLSGSNQIVFRDLYRKLENIQKPAHIIDISNDSLGYIDDFTSDFFGYPNDSPDIRHYIRRLLLLGTLFIDAETLKTEKEVALKYGFKYNRIPLKARTIPSAGFVDNFVEVIENIPPNAWIHIYSQSGRGRMSLAMVMVDILRNCNKVPLEDIVHRQFLLGSQNLMDVSLWRNGTYTEDMLKNRKSFIESFYAYAKQRPHGKAKTWVEWQKLSPMIIHGKLSDLENNLFGD